METEGDSFTVNNLEVVEHNEEVVTSSVEEEVLQQQQTVTLSQPAVYAVPTISIPVMQIVTLPPIQTAPTTAQPTISNPLRNIRLFAYQPKPVVNGNSITSKPVAQQQQTVIVSRPPFQGATKQQQIALQQILAKSKQLPQQPVPSQTISATQISAKSFYGNKYAGKSGAGARVNPQFWKEQKRAKELEEVSHLSLELQEGFKVLQDLMSPALKNNNIFFMDKVDPLKDGAPDYYQVIKRPLWLNKIREKLKNSEYKDITELVTEIRIMLENCYRYNGPNHPITKKAMRLEQILEQKITSLPENLKEKCLIEKSFGPEITIVDKETVQNEGKRLVVSGEPYFSYILHRVKDEREKREKEIREKLLEEQRRKREEKEKRIKAWANKMMNEKVKRQMRLMWEIPQIGHFLHLARKALHIGEIAQYELEHMFLMPEASVLLATLVTSLLSSPNQRVKLAEAPPPEYTTWSAKLQSKVAEWYRAYNREGRNAIKVFENLGVETSFWTVCGERSPLETKPYHELSFLKRVWIFKTLCDVVFHSHKTVQEAMAEEEGPESREVVLGQDSQGYTYIHFPAVSGSDIRVYRQSKWALDKDPFWGPLCEEREAEEEEKAREEEERLWRIERRASEAVASKSKAKRKAQPRKGPSTPQRRTQKKKPTPSAAIVATRISPRTLQRHTGLSTYKETSEEEDEEDSEEAVEDSSSDEDFETRRKREMRKGGRNAKRRKTLENIEEENEEEEETDGEEEEGAEEEEEEEVEENDEENEEDEKNSGEKEEKETDKPTIKTENDEKEIKEEEEEKVEENQTEKQGFTVSQLMKKMNEEEVKEENDEKQIKEEEEEAEEDADPDRPLFDPFYFELVISSVSELRDWITKYADTEDKPRPRNETRLRNRLTALLEEAEPLAADQLIANERICRLLWKQWDAHYNPERDDSSDSDESYDEEAEEEAEPSQWEEEPADDGLRHSKRLRKRKKGSGESESGGELSAGEEADSRPSKRGMYEEDPMWEESEKRPPRKLAFQEHMKDPQYWKGRRVTRAAAQFVGNVPFDEDYASSQDTVGENSSSSREAPTAGAKEEETSEELMNQLRQLRRQQALLCSNDRLSEASKSINGGSPVLLPIKNNQGKATLVQVTNERAAEVLKQIKRNFNDTPPQTAANPIASSPAEAGSTASPTPNGTTTPQQPVKLIIVNNTQPNSVLGPETLARILGPEARTGKLSVVKTPTGGKNLVLILANGAIQNITAPQLAQIQEVLRAKRDTNKQQLQATS